MTALGKVTFQWQYVYISAQRKRENESRFSMFYLEKKRRKIRSLFDVLGIKEYFTHLHMAYYLKVE